MGVNKKSELMLMSRATASV